MASKPRGASAPKPGPAPAAAPAPIEPPDAAPAPVDEPIALEQVVEAPPIEVAEPESAAAPAPDEPAPELDDFIAAHERAAQSVDLVVTAISHPDAKPRHHQGVYSGFPIGRGPLSATYSDGSTH